MQQRTSILASMKSYHPTSPGSFSSRAKTGTTTRCWVGLFPWDIYAASYRMLRTPWLGRWPRLASLDSVVCRWCSCIAKDWNSN